MMKLAPLLSAVSLLWACSEDSKQSSSTAGAGGMSGGNAGGGGAAGNGTLPEPVIQKGNLSISRGKPTFSAPAGGAAVVDGNYHGGGWAAGSPTQQAPAWVAIQVGAGPQRLLVVWDDGGTYNYQDMPGTAVYGLPAAYRMEVSNDSTNGQDGTWANVVTVPSNNVRTRGHAIDFSGQSWVKLLVTGTPEPAPNGVSIGEIDVHDMSATGSGMPEDTWLFMGDSLTAFAYDRATAHQPSFAAGINAAKPAFFPAMINAGIGGELASGALARLDAVLELNPAYHFVVLGYGTNDAANNQVPVATFKTTMQSLIDKVEAGGRIPVIPHIPPAATGMHDGIPNYNRAIDQLNTENDLQPGPDLFAYFSDNPGLFTCPPCGGSRMTDNLHPNDDGLKGMNAAWTTAMSGLYSSEPAP
jgi:lysophospholipase L1-like esterase